MKTITFRSEATPRLLSAAKLMSDAVGATLGPSGRTVIIDNNNKPFATKDGVTVAKAMHSEDRLANLCIQLIRDGANEAVHECGDGTTTTTILTESIYREGARYVTAGAHPMKLKEGVDAGVKYCVGEFRKHSVSINEDDTKARLKQVATISCNGDTSLGETISEVIVEVGSQGVIQVEEGTGLETEWVIEGGMAFPSGMCSPYFANFDNECRLDDPYVLLSDAKIQYANQILPLLERLYTQGNKPLCIIGEEIIGEALKCLILNATRKGMRLCAIKAPGVGERRQGWLDDIAISTGTRVFSPKHGMLLEDVPLNLLGTCRQMVIGMEETIIKGGGAYPKEMMSHLKKLGNQLQALPKYDREIMSERIAKLSGGIGLIKVGAYTEVELKERKARLEDALSATQAALEEGVLPGGAVTYARCIEGLTRMSESSTGDKRLGLLLLRDALKAPLRKLSTNVGFESGELFPRVRGTDANVAWCAKTDQLDDMFKLGVIDPAKVTRVSLQKAASVAMTLLTTEAAIYHSK